MAGEKTEAAKVAAVASPAPAATPTEAAATVEVQLSYTAKFLKKHGWRLIPLFLGLLLPAFFFAGLVEEYREDGLLPFDKPILMWMHANASVTVDQLAVLVSNLGYLWGVVPFDVALVLLLVVRKRYREALFFGLAVGGSVLLNLAAKAHYARARPDFWQHIVDENSYSFPSGHAMGSATLATALVLLCWRTRWHWPAVVLFPAFALLVGLSRIYLGVHFPSDILAGFAIAVAWVFGMHQLVGRAPKPRAEKPTSSIEHKAKATRAKEADEAT